MSYSYSDWEDNWLDWEASDDLWSYESNDDYYWECDDNNYWDNNDDYWDD